MTAANKIYAFGQDPGANTLDDATYAADAQLAIGNQPGTARAQFVNKTLRQAVAMAVGFAQFLADNQATDVTDALAGSALSAMMADSLRASSGGALRDTMLVSAATVLAAADVGKAIRTNGSGYAISLPLASACKNGDLVFVQCSGIGPVSVATQGSDIIDTGSANVSSMSMMLGEDLVLVRVGAGVWAPVSGSANLRNADSFASTLSIPGKKILPGDFLLQWGTVATLAGGPAAVTFPTTFPRATLAFLPVVSQSSAYIATFDTLLTTGVNVNGYNTAGARAAFSSVWWLALGW